ncbi:MAG: DUF1570 domain-containing protein [Planctomycetota bacterium]|nr:DUF1570 domain-containing protein [Planctomycetota bacterium]
MPSPFQLTHIESSSSRRFAIQALSPVIVIALSISIAVAGSSPRMIEVSDDIQTYSGMIVAKSADDCFIVDPFGQQVQLPIHNLKNFSVVAENYRPASPGNFKRMLETEFGSEYEVVASKHYVVCGTRGRGRSYATLFEDIFNQVDSFYSLRGFKTSKPATPLVALVLKDLEAFKKYCERDQMAWTEGLRGYYSLKSNRIAMYDRPEAFQSVRMMSDTSVLSHDTALIKASASAVAGETADTIIHEATHQVGFNIGIHSRIGGTPAWVLEGMATVLEAPGMRSRSSAARHSDKVNQHRLDWFHGEYAQRRRPGDLAKLIASDDMFRSQTLDAYSAAWGITWFLTENPARARMFSRYLNSVSERDPMASYSAAERLEDFQRVFGDISRIEVDYVRAMDRL